MSSTRVYVGRLSYRARERDLADYFGTYGRIRDIVLKDGFGFVDFDDARAADDAVHDDGNGRSLMGERIKVEYARSRDRGRGGGAYGGGGGGGGGGGDRWGYGSRREPNRMDRCGQTQTGHRLIVENLSSRVTWQGLKDLMRGAGRVIYADAHKQRKNEGIVCFATRADLERGLEKYQGFEFEGRELKLIEDLRSSRRVKSTHSVSSGTEQLGDSSVQGDGQTTPRDIAQLHTEDPKAVMDTFRSVLTMARDSYLNLHLYANEREEALVLINHIVNDDERQPTEEHEASALKALHDIGEHRSLDSLLHSVKESGDGGMAKLRQQLAIIWQLFLKMDATDKEHARNLLKELSEEDVSSVPPFPIELLTKMASMLGGQHSDTSFADRVHLADTCRVMRSAVSDSIRQMPERVMMIAMNWSFTAVNGVRVSNDQLERIGALVAFGQPTAVVVRPMPRTYSPPSGLSEDFPLVMPVMMSLTAGEVDPSHWLSSSTTIHLCCRRHSIEDSVDIVQGLDEVSCARITAVCCAEYRESNPAYLKLLAKLPNCRKFNMRGKTFAHHGVDIVDITVDTLHLCRSVVGHRGKTLEMRIHLDEQEELFWMDKEIQWDAVGTRNGTTVHGIMDMNECCDFNASEMLQHRL